VPERRERASSCAAGSVERASPRLPTVRCGAKRFAGSRGVRDTDNRVRIDMLVTGGIPGDGTLHGVVFPDPAAVAVEIEGKKYLSLGALMELKIASGLSAPHRLKDLADAIQLIRVNRLGEHFGDQLHAYVRPKYRELWRLAQHADDEY
jgi:hypothetical protein